MADVEENSSTVTTTTTTTDSVVPVLVSTTEKKETNHEDLLNPKTLPWELGNITKANIKQLRLINIHTLPVRYSDKFYDELLDRYDHTYLKYAFVSGFVVGAICARIEKDENNNLSNKKLYIMTLNVLAPYRRFGIASGLLKYVLNQAQEDLEIGEVYLHVQTNNDTAKQFYHRHGFDEIEIIKDYYKKIEPADCYLLKKVLRAESIGATKAGEDEKHRSISSVDAEFS